MNEFAWLRGCSQGARGYRGQAYGYGRMRYGKWLVGIFRLNREFFLLGKLHRIVSEGSSREFQESRH